MQYDPIILLAWKAGSMGRYCLGADDSETWHQKQKEGINADKLIWRASMCLTIRMERVTWPRTSAKKCLRQRYGQ